MTDKEKLEAIRAEIHRLIDVRSYDREMANDLFAFMDSLKEDELTKDDQKVSNAYCRKIRDKRVLPILKGESKHKFINEFNTLYQTLDMQLCDRCMKEPLKNLCLAFATWGAYNLKDIGRVDEEERTKMDSMQEEPKIPQVFDEGYWERLGEEPVSIWHDASEEPKPNMELICVGQYGNPLVLSSNSDSFKSRYISKWAYFNDLLNLSNVSRTAKNWEEPVSEELEKVADQYSQGIESDYTNDMFDRGDIYEAVIYGAQWQKRKDEYITEDLGEYISEIYKQFPEVSFAKLSRIAVRVAKWQKEHLWKSADGDDLPEIDREVIALLDNGKVVFAHRPNPDGWNGKSLSTGKVEHYTPKTYDKGGWNIPEVKYWLDVELPKEIEL